MTRYWNSTRCETVSGREGCSLKTLVNATVSQLTGFPLLSTTSICGGKFPSAAMPDTTVREGSAKMLAVASAGGGSGGSCTTTKKALANVAWFAPAAFTV